MRQILRGRSKAATSPLKRRINHKLPIDDHCVRATKRIRRTCITLHHTSQSRSILRNRIDQLQRFEQSSIGLVVKLPARYFFNDHSQHAVVGVGIVPAVASLEWSFFIEQISHQLGGLPYLVRICREVFGEPLFELITHETTS